MPVNDADLPSPTRGTVPPPSGASDYPTDPEPFIAGTFDLSVVGEASGVAVSVRNPGWIYVLDDGPGADGVVAVDTSSGATVRVVIEGLSGRDTEGLALGACVARRNRQCLFIGDIGNNQDQWTSVDVWRVREPSLRRRDEIVTTGGAVATYTYAGEPVNAEALLVEDGRPHLVTKERRDPESGRAPPPRLLATERWGDGVLRDLGPISLPEPTLGLAAAAVGNVVTGGELFGDRVVLRTYDHAVEYTPRRAGASLDTLATWSAREIDGIPALPQPEGLAVDNCGLWLVSERVDSIWLVPQRSPASDETQEQACPTGSGPS